MQAADGEELDESFTREEIKDLLSMVDFEVLHTVDRYVFTYEPIYGKGATIDWNCATFMRPQVIKGEWK